MRVEGGILWAGVPAWPASSDPASMGGALSEGGVMEERAGETRYERAGDVDCRRMYST